MMGRILNNNNNNTHETEGRTIAERYHLLSHHIVRRILTSPKPSTPSVDPKESIFLLLLFLNEALWDRVTDIAVQTAKRGRLEMDVNKQKPIKSIPAPIGQQDDPAEVPQGASFHALAFLVAMALRK